MIRKSGSTSETTIQPLASIKDSTLNNNSMKCYPMFEMGSLPSLLIDYQFNTNLFIDSYFIVLLIHKPIRYYHCNSIMMVIIQVSHLKKFIKMRTLTQILPLIITSKQYQGKNRHPSHSVSIAPVFV